MTVHWTDTAIEHLIGIHEYIASDSPQYALRTVDRITGRSKQLAAHPFSGAMVPEYEQRDIREVIERPYRIIYRVKPDQIDVLAVIHGAHLLPPTVAELGE